MTRTLLNEAISSDPDDGIFLFDQMQGYFFYLFGTEPPQIGTATGKGLPFDKVMEQATKTYKICNATIAEPPHYPSEQQKEAMTSFRNWIELVGGDSELTLKFPPGQENSSFISCFNEKITDWISGYHQAQSEHDYRFLIGILVTVAVVGIVCCVGFSAYQKYQGRKHVEKITTGPISIFQKKRDEETGSPYGETTRLLEMNHPHVAMNTGPKALGETNPMFGL